MTLQEEIDRRRKEIRTDGYPMSIGEWISMYENGELDLHPEFQRLFRWTPHQRSKFIESIILGIPIPPIFVSQRTDGVWDVVDGLQRLSTIFEFIGVLKSDDGTVLPPLALEGTRDIPGLAGVRWNADDAGNPNTEKTFSVSQRLQFKRTKISVSIILMESSPTAKFDLFQRLNTGGSQLSDQEVRSSIMVMLNPASYQWLWDRSRSANFIECTGLSDRAIAEQYDIELALRFVVFRRIDEGSLNGIGDLGEFLTYKAAELSQSAAFDYAGETNAFNRTFDVLQTVLSSDCFRRWNSERNRYLGGFSVSAFEAIALGIGFHADAMNLGAAEISERSKSIWSTPEFIENSGSGVRASTRVPRVIPFGRRLFA